MRDPSRQLDGETIGRLMFWQLGGLGLVAPLATFVATVSGSTITLVTHAEAFQPRGGSGPTLARTSAGIYTFAYPSTAADEQGASRALTLRGGLCSAQSSTYRHCQVALGSDPWAGTIYAWDSAASAADATPMLVVLW